MTDAHRPPTLPRDVRVTIADLEAIAYAASWLAKQVADLHVLAYERQVGGETVRAVRTSRFDWYLDEQGVAKAKDALRLLMAEKSGAGAKGLKDTLGEHVSRAQDLLSGPGADNSLRGTLLGDERGHGAQRELTAALKAQERRIARGEYAPARSEPQPKRVPGS